MVSPGAVRPPPSDATGAMLVSSFSVCLSVCLYDCLSVRPSPCLSVSSFHNPHGWIMRLNETDLLWRMFSAVALTLLVSVRPIRNDVDETILCLVTFQQPAVANSNVTSSFVDGTGHEPPINGTYPAVTVCAIYSRPNVSACCCRPQGGSALAYLTHD